MRGSSGAYNAWCALVDTSLGSAENFSITDTLKTKHGSLEEMEITWANTKIISYTRFFSFSGFYTALPMNLRKEEKINTIVQQNYHFFEIP